MPMGIIPRGIILIRIRKNFKIGDGLSDKDEHLKLTYNGCFHFGEQCSITRECSQYVSFPYIYLS